MKYICLGYMEPKKFETMSESEINSFMDECFAYDEVLRKNGNYMGAALQSSRDVSTLRWRDGKIVITDGPFIETKEQLGGLLLLEANDLNHAIQIMSKHPALKGGPFEIRPAADLAEMVRKSELRRTSPQ